MGRVAIDGARVEGCEGAANGLASHHAHCFPSSKGPVQNLIGVLGRSTNAAERCRRGLTPEDDIRLDVSTPKPVTDAMRVVMDGTVRTAMLSAWFLR